jgi:DNA modification methylase
LPARPALKVFTTTLWTYPSQHYDSATAGGRSGGRMQGDQNYEGATPSWVIWQLLMRYTREGDTVLDPMCGSGTTLDVCADLGRRALGFDLVPRREGIAQADARRLPLKDESVDFAFIDPPYSTHVRYSDDPRCIGKLDSGGRDGGAAYYAAMAEVVAELARVLKARRYMGLYVSDSYRKASAGQKGEFMPIGFELFATLRRHFRAVDIVAVVRGNAKLDQPHWHKASIDGNYFLRGFNYLFIMKKE